MSAYDTQLLIVRLATGEELLAKTTVTPTKVQMSAVTIIVPTQSGTIQLAPYLPYADQNCMIEITSDKVIFTIPPHKKLAEEYERAHSDIMLPETKSIII